MSNRMAHAIWLSTKNWAKARRDYPDFVAAYLQHAEELLLSRPVVMGDEFRSYCEKKGLSKPKKLSHNVWVTGPRVLAKLRWTVSMGKVEPAQKHNHMPSVTLWRSLIFGQDNAEPATNDLPLFTHERITKA
jgi:hypothetical protein